MNWFKTNKRPSIKLIGGIGGKIIGVGVMGCIFSTMVNLPLELRVIKQPVSNPECLIWTLSLLLPITLIGGGWWQYQKRVGWPKWTRQTSLTVIGGIFSMGVIEIGLMTLNNLLTREATTPNNAALMVFKQAGVRSLFYATVVVMAPMMEELVYRGGCQHLLAKQLRTTNHGNAWALVLSSLVFGLMHQGGTPIGKLTYVLMGVVLGMVYQHTHDLRACTLVHLVNNGLAALSM
ncbi:CPBP family intramembrane glutamic endopeptidase [Secundilactobacillus kimchicus]|uniref:CPBP family intramembrane glutamic endopeptidase n=1 Tax=Secundilactobacillus kimchicus TaxID=528209 RepID=UPI0024A8F853|nr:CPBP family intramembrane glutamic endopeptidase [Secundilactobacillus kimchicus]